MMLKKMCSIAPIVLLVLLSISCSKEYSMETGMNSIGISVGTLQDQTGNCDSLEQRGIYRAQQPLTDSNYVLARVTVQTPGRYLIATDTANGFWFRDSGFFTAPGQYTVRLTGRGRPTLAAISTFTVRYGNSFCSFNITPQAAGTGAMNEADTAWQFMENSQRFHGHIDSAVFRNSNGIQYLRIMGNPITNDSSFFMQLLLNGGTPLGTYSSAAGTLVFEFKTAAGNTIYDARQGDGSTLIVTVNSYDATSKILNASFSGTVKDASGSDKNVNAGKLQLQVQ